MLKIVNHKNTIRFLFLLVVLLVTVALAIPISASANGYVHMNAIPSQTSVAQGEEFTVDVNLTGVDPVNGIGTISLYLQINSTTEDPKFEYVSETHLPGHSEEDWIIGYNATTKQVAMVFVDNSMGNPILADCNYVTLTLRALTDAEVGPATLLFTKKSILDRDGDPVIGTIDTPTIDMTITEFVPTPTPTPIPTPTPTPVPVDPSFELNLVDVGSRTLSLTGHYLDPNSSYQIWVEEQYIEGGNYWRLVKAYYEAFSEPISGGTAVMTWSSYGNLNDSYKIYIRVKNSLGEVTQYSKQFSARQIGLFRINYLTVDGLVPVDKTVKQAGSVVNFTVSADKAAGNSATIKFKYYINGMLYSISSSPTFFWAIPTNTQPGWYKFTVISYQEGSTANYDLRDAFIYVYNNAVIVPELTNGGFNLAGSTITEIPVGLNMISNIVSGTGGNATYKFEIAEPMKAPFATLPLGNTFYSFEYPGIYQIFGSVMNMNAPTLSDGAIKTVRVYRSGYPSASINRNSVLVEKRQYEIDPYFPVQLDCINEYDFVRITAPANPDYQYSFWKLDSLGYKEVQGWSSSNVLLWRPPQAGKYTIQIRVRFAIYAGTNASYEDEESFEFSIQGVDQVISGLTITAPSSTPKRVPVEISANCNGTVDSSNVMYRFEVTDELLGRQILQPYSMLNTCIFVPRKAGIFKIIVRAKDARSFGYYDTYAEHTITAY